MLLRHGNGMCLGGIHLKLRTEYLAPGAGPWEAILFDLDGTVIDSEPNYRKADKAFLSSRGIHFADEVWPRFVGMGSKAFIELMIRDHGMKGNLDDLMAQKDAYYLEIARKDTVAFPAMVELNRMARAAGLKTAIASGSSPLVIEESLRCAGLTDCYDLLFSSSQVERSKPFPDVFLQAASLLGVKSGRCLVIEDSVPGALAGLAAGMTVLAVPYEESHRNHEVFTRVPFLLETDAYGLDTQEFLGLAKSLGLWPAL